MSEPAPFVGNVLLLAGALAAAWFSPALKAASAAPDPTAQAETPPASQPGPEGNR